ncbi:MAG: CapA family protein [Gammaproteobacteria bacterium]|nr:CapA family protein [Gammaproteobacteria bacterium]
MLDYGKILLLLSSSRFNVGNAAARPSSDSALITLFMCGDVMTGRGIDQVLPRPSDPRLYESYVKNATRYVELAQSVSGPFPKRVDFSYPWGDALDELERVMPDVRIINLETAVTVSNHYWKRKSINYRMHPENILCIKAAKIDCCAIANNHVLDWGYAGLEDTLASLEHVNVKGAGAGRNITEAEAPAVMGVNSKGRVLLFAYASPTAGVPRDWAATNSRSGVNFLADLSQKTVRRITAQVQKVKRQGDIVVASIHWGGNWGYDIPDEQRNFSHWLIDEAGVDVIHGHSSHHPKGIEVYDGSPIVYGCGDFLNDYEGISGHEEYRDDLVLMYLVTMQRWSGKLVRFEMVPFQIKRFRLDHVSREDARWLRRTMNRECARFGGHVALSETDRLTLDTVAGASDFSRIS